LADLSARQARGWRGTLDRRDQRLRDLGRALPRLDALLSAPRQRFDAASQRLGAGLSLATARKRARFETLSAPLRPAILTTLLQSRRNALAAAQTTLNTRADLRLERAHSALDKWASRLAPALARLIATSARDIAKHQDQLAALSLRLNAALPKRLSDLQARLDALDRTRQTLGYAETLRRGYAVVWGDGAVVTNKDQADAAQVLELEFHDGRITPKSNPKKPKTSDPKPSQGSLF
jgi:exodeoxyribonuclease VII large subunit